MNRIGLLTNFNIPEKSETIFAVCKLLRERGLTPILPSYVASGHNSACDFRSLNCEYMPTAEIYKSVEAIIIAGGDGWILDTAKSAAEYSVPVLGINRGRVGYITELEPDELTLINNFLDGKYDIEKRFIIHADVNEGEKSYFSGLAFNDAVVTGSTVGAMAETALYEKDNLVEAFRGDGLIIATPTGSTAYSLSAGGPVIDPRMSCFCITPICSHSPTARPLVFPGDVGLTVSINGNRCKELAVIIDGKYACKLKPGQKLELRAYEKPALFIRLKARRYYSTLCRKIY